METQNTSGSSRPSFRWMFQRDAAVSLDGLEGLADVRSSTFNPTRTKRGQHRIRYKTSIGRRMAVKAESELPAPNVYNFVPSSDTLRDRRRVWVHSGQASGGNAFVWSRAIAHYERDEASLSSVTIKVQIWGDSPADRPLEGHITIPLN